MYHEFCDHCPLCRPSILNITTGKKLPDDSPTMIKVSRMWTHETTYKERKAFIDVTAHNRQTPENMRLANTVIEKMRKLMMSG